MKEHFLPSMWQFTDILKDLEGNLNTKTNSLFDQFLLNSNFGFLLILKFLKSLLNMWLFVTSDPLQFHY